MSTTPTVAREFVQCLQSAIHELKLVLPDGFPPLVDGRRVPVTDIARYLTLLAKQNHDPSLGLRLGANLPPAAFSTLGHLVMVCNTVGQAVVLVEEFQRLITDAFRFTCEPTPAGLACRWRLQPSLTPASQYRVLIDLILSATHQFGLWVANIHEPYSEVRFQYPAVDGSARCQQYFGHPGLYGCEDSGFVVPLEWAERPIRTANRQLQPLLYRQANSELKSILVNAPSASSLSEVILALLPEGQATIERVASTLGISTRSLQRQLSQQNMSFSKVLQTIRYQRAEYLLAETDLSLTEIATRLGYREQSSFSSAFRSWTGHSPREARLKIRQSE